MHERELKTLRNRYTKMKYDIENNNVAYLKIAQKKEKELDRVYREDRIKRELITLKIDFQTKWYGVLSFISLIKCFFLKYSIQKNKLMHREMSLKMISNSMTTFDVSSIQFGSNPKER